PNQTEDFSETVEVINDSLIIDWNLNSPSTQRDQDGMPIIDGFSNDERPGHPKLPYKTLTFAIPNDGSVSYTVQLGEPIVSTGLADIPIAPAPNGLELNQVGEITGGAFSPAPLQDNLTIDHISVEEIGKFAGARIGTVTFYPISFANGTMKQVSKATIEINFNRSNASRTTATENSDTLNSIQQLIINPTHLEVSKSAKRSSVPAPQQPTTIIHVAEVGMVEVSYQDWVASGLGAGSFKPNQLQITHKGIALSYQWIGDSDNVFEPNESVIFYAPEYHSRWTHSAPFLFNFDGSSQNLMGQRSGSNPSASGSANTQIHTFIEENLLYSSDCLCGVLPTGWDGDRWFWKEMRRPGTDTVTVDFELQHVNSSIPAEMTLWLIGFTTQDANPDHLVSVKLNGTNLGTTTWDGKTLHLPNYSLAAGLLQNSNQLELSLVNGGSSIDGVWLDAIELTYGFDNSESAIQKLLLGSTNSSSYAVALNSTSSLSLYDISDSSNPVELTSPTRNGNSVSWSDQGNTDATYSFVPNNAFISPSLIQTVDGLAEYTAGGSYIIIAPREFAENRKADRLKILREDLGWQVVIEETEEIYAAFSDGQQNNPQAIRDYLEWAYHSWEIQPEMVLLVGDGTNDPKQFRETTATVRVPSYLAEADPWIGETAADNRYVTVDGDDLLPDMALGRLPVNSIDEFEGVVDKIIAYELRPFDNDWDAEATIIADDNDLAGNFDDLSNGLINQYLQSPLQPERIYLGTNDLEADAAYSQILERWKRGQGMIMFTGHSSIHQWAAERLFHIDDVENLRNGSNLPIMLQMTCFTGSYHSSTFNTLDEQLVRQWNGGAVAAWGATGLGVATGHDELASGALEKIYSQSETTLGAATLAGKLKLATQKPAYSDLLDTFNLLGDPALVVGREVKDDLENFQFRLSSYSLNLPLTQTE
ncbi:MAG: C25 family cysteine peptidase, partial [Chloroflexota bacterium]